MPKRAVIYGVQVFRDGKIVAVKAGTTFNFTGDEIDDIRKANPKALRPVPIEDLEAEKKAAESPEQRAARVQAENDEAARIQAENDAAVKQKEIDDADADAAKEKAAAELKAAEKAVADAKVTAKNTPAKGKGPASTSADSL